jgi:hypothetical protein
MCVSCSLRALCTRLSSDDTLRGRSQVKDIASRSGLEKSNLRALWSLADTGVKGRLTFAEFGLLLGESFVSHPHHHHRSELTILSFCIFVFKFSPVSFVHYCIYIPDAYNSLSSATSTKCMAISLSLQHNITRAQA